MTDATAEVRRLLDERGVEYHEYYSQVAGSMGLTTRFYLQDSEHHAYASIEIGIAGLSGQSNCLLTLRCTPQQAIDATLGPDPDDAAVENLHDRLNAALLNYARSQEHTKERITAVIEAHAVLELAVALGCGARIAGDAE